MEHPMFQVDECLSRYLATGAKGFFLSQSEPLFAIAKIDVIEFWGWNSSVPSSAFEVVEPLILRHKLHTLKHISRLTTFASGNDAEVDGVFVLFEDATWSVLRYDVEKRCFCALHCGGALQPATATTTATTGGANLNPAGPIVAADGCTRDSGTLQRRTTLVVVSIWESTLHALSFNHGGGGSSSAVSDEGGVTVSVTAVPCVLRGLNASAKPFLHTASTAGTGGQRPLDMPDPPTSLCVLPPSTTSTSGTTTSSNAKRLLSVTHREYVRGGQHQPRYLVNVQLVALDLSAKRLSPGPFGVDNVHPATLQCTHMPSSAGTRGTGASVGVVTVSPTEAALWTPKGKACSVPLSVHGSHPTAIAPLPSCTSTTSTSSSNSSSYLVSFACGTLLAITISTASTSGTSGVPSMAVRGLSPAGVLCPYANMWIAKSGGSSFSVLGAGHCSDWQVLEVDSSDLSVTLTVAKFVDSHGPMTCASLQRAAQDGSNSSSEEHQLLCVTGGGGGSGMKEGEGVPASCARLRVCRLGMSLRAVLGGAEDSPATDLVGVVAEDSLVYGPPTLFPISLTPGGRHEYLAFSYGAEEQTTLMSLRAHDAFMPVDPDDTEMKGWDCGARTLAVGLTPTGLLIQVTPKEGRILSIRRTATTRPFITEPASHGVGGEVQSAFRVQGRTIEHAACDGNLVALTCVRDLYIVRIDGPQAPQEPTASLRMPQQISCVALLQSCEGGDGTVAVGQWVENCVVLLHVPTMRQLRKIVLPSQPRALLLLPSFSPKEAATTDVFAGMASGHVAHTHGGGESSTDVYAVGREPVHSITLLLQQDGSEGRYVHVGSDESCVLHVREGAVVCTRVCSKREARGVVGVRCEWLKGGGVAYLERVAPSAANTPDAYTVVFGRLDTSISLRPHRSMALRGTGTSTVGMLHHQDSQCFVVAGTSHDSSQAVLELYSDRTHERLLRMSLVHGHRFTALHSFTATTGGTTISVVAAAVHSGVGSHVAYMHVAHSSDVARHTYDVRLMFVTHLGNNGVCHALASGDIEGVGSHLFVAQGSTIRVFHVSLVPKRPHVQLEPREVCYAHTPNDQHCTAIHVLGSTVYCSHFMGGVSVFALDSASRALVPTCTIGGIAQSSVLPLSPSTLLVGDMSGNILCYGIQPKHEEEGEEEGERDPLAAQIAALQQNPPQQQQQGGPAAAVVAQNDDEEDFMQDFSEPSSDEESEGEQPSMPVKAGKEREANQRPHTAPARYHQEEGAVDVSTYRAPPELALLQVPLEGSTLRGRRRQRAGGEGCKWTHEATLLSGFCVGDRVTSMMKGSLLMEPVSPAPGASSHSTATIVFTCASGRTGTLQTLDGSTFRTLSERANQALCTLSTAVPHMTMPEEGGCGVSCVPCTSARVWEDVARACGLGEGLIGDHVDLQTEVPNHFVQNRLIKLAKLLVKK